VDLQSAAERVLKADFMPMPLTGQPVKGFTRVSSTTFVMSIARVRSNVWLLKGFGLQRTFWDSLATLLHVSR
jgi:hypothetical protein